MAVSPPALAFLRALPDPAVLLTPAGLVVAVNHKARVLLALPADADVVGTAFADVLGTTDHTGLSEAIRGWARTADPLPGAFSATRGGTSTVFNAKGAVVVPADADAPAILLVRFWPRSEANPFVLLNQKVTQLNDEVARRIQVEDALRRSETALQERVQEAESLNRAKDEFLAIVSHELRTPLNAILGWSSLLRQRVTDPQVARGVEVIHRNALAQTRLIDDVLDVSRIISGKMRVEPRMADLGAIVEEAVDVVRPSAAAKDITLDWQRPSQPLPLVVDPDRLQQAVWNLCSNAVKFTARGGTIRVSAGREGSRLAVTVVDTGVGIDPAFLPFVFDRFRQADSSTTRSAGGLGLGLALTRSIVELHGGTVQAESAGLGQGATFTISMPLHALVPDEPAAIPHQAPPSTATLLPQEALSGLRILVVDDEADARDVLATALEHAGARVETAASVGAAFDELPRFRPHAVVSDIGMPVEDGYVLARRLRALPADEGGLIPAIALTAYTREDDRAQALQAGFSTHVGKPVSAHELVQALATLTCAVGRRDPS